MSSQNISGGSAKIASHSHPTAPVKAIATDAAEADLEGDEEGDGDEGLASLTAGTGAPGKSAKNKKKKDKKKNRKKATVGGGDIEGDGHEDAVTDALEVPTVDVGAAVDDESTAHLPTSVVLSAQEPKPESVPTSTSTPSSVLVPLIQSSDILDVSEAVQESTPAPLSSILEPFTPEEPESTRQVGEQTNLTPGDHETEKEEDDVVVLEEPASKEGTQDKADVQVPVHLSMQENQIQTGTEPVNEAEPEADIEVENTTALDTKTDISKGINGTSVRPETAQTKREEVLKPVISSSAPSEEHTTHHEPTAVPESDSASTARPIQTEERSAQDPPNKDPGQLFGEDAESGGDWLQDVPQASSEPVNDEVEVEVEVKEDNLDFDAETVELSAFSDGPIVSDEEESGFWQLSSDVPVDAPANDREAAEMLPISENGSARDERNHQVTQPEIKSGSEAEELFGASGNSAADMTEPENAFWSQPSAPAVDPEEHDQESREKPPIEVQEEVKKEYLSAASEPVLGGDDELFGSLDIPDNAFPIVPDGEVAAEEEKRSARLSSEDDEPALQKQDGQSSTLPVEVPKSAKLSETVEETAPAEDDPFAGASDPADDDFFAVAATSRAEDDFFSSQLASANEDPSSRPKDGSTSVSTQAVEDDLFSSSAEPTDALSWLNTDTTAADFSVDVPADSEPLTLPDDLAGVDLDAMGVPEGWLDETGAWLWYTEDERQEVARGMIKDGLATAPPSESDARRTPVPQAASSLPPVLSTVAPINPYIPTPSSTTAYNPQQQVNVTKYVPSAPRPPSVSTSSYSPYGPPTPHFVAPPVVPALSSSHTTSAYDPPVATAATATLSRYTPSSSPASNPYAPQAASQPYSSMTLPRSFAPPPLPPAPAPPPLLKRMTTSTAYDPPIPPSQKLLRPASAAPTFVPPMTSAFTGPPSLNIATHPAQMPVPPPAPPKPVASALSRSSTPTAYDPPVLPPTRPKSRSSLSHQGQAPVMGSPPPPPVPPIPATLLHGVSTPPGPPPPPPGPPRGPPRMASMGNLRQQEPIQTAGTPPVPPIPQQYPQQQQQQQQQQQHQQNQQSQQHQPPLQHEHQRATSRSPEQHRGTLHDRSGSISPVTAMRPPLQFKSPPKQYQPPASHDGGFRVPKHRSQLSLETAITEEPSTFPENEPNVEEEYDPEAGEPYEDEEFDQETAIVSPAIEDATAPTLRGEDHLPHASLSSPAQPESTLPTCPSPPRHRPGLQMDTFQPPSQTHTSTTAAYEPRPQTISDSTHQKSQADSARQSLAGDSTVSPKPSIVDRYAPRPAVSADDTTARPQPAQTSTPLLDPTSRPPISSMTSSIYDHAPPIQPPVPQQRSVYDPINTTDDYTPESDPLGRGSETARRVPCASFGTTGQLLLVFPSSEEDRRADQSGAAGYGFSSAGRTVQLRNLATTIPSTVGSSSTVVFPGPLLFEGGSTKTAASDKKKREQVEKYLAERIEELEVGLPYISSAKHDLSERNKEEAKILLLRIIQKIVQNDGKAVTDDTAMLASLLASSATMPEPDRRHSATQSQGTLGNEEQLAYLSSLLIHAQRKEALAYAVDNQLWTHALIIASSIGPEAWQQTTSSYSRSILAASDNPATRHVLPTIYNLYGSAGSLTANGNSFDHLSTEDIINTWRDLLAAVIGNSKHGETANAEALGDKLSAAGLLEAGHVCYLVTSLLPAWLSGNSALIQKYPLLGHLSTERTEDSTIYSELLEYALALRPVPKGGDSYAGILHLLPYKINKAHQLLASGNKAEAQKYCDSILGSLKVSRLNAKTAPTLINLVDSLTAVLAGKELPNTSLKQGSKPNLDKLGSWFEGRLTKFIAGDDDGAKNAPPDKLAAPTSGEVVGPFTHYSTISSEATQTAPTRPPSAFEGEGRSTSPFQHRTGSAMGYRPVPENESGTTHRPKSALAHPITGSAVPPLSQADSGLTAAYSPTGPSYGYEPKEGPTRSSFEDRQDPIDANVPSQTPSWGRSYGFETEAQSDQAPVESDPDAIFNPMQAMMPNLLGAATDRYALTGSKSAALDDFDDEDDLGFGNSTSKREKKPPVKEPKQEAAPKQEQSKEKPAEEAKAEHALRPAASSTWLGKWWGKKEDSTTPPPIRAKLGNQNSMYYDKELKRWITPGAAVEAPKAAPPPPRAVSKPATPAPTPTSMTPAPPSGLPPRGISTPPNRSATVGPPPQPPTTDMPPRPSSSSASMSDPPIGNALALPPSRKAVAGKKNIRSRYVDVMQ